MSIAKAKEEQILLYQVEINVIKYVSTFAATKNSISILQL